MDSTEKRLGNVAEIMAGLTGFADKGKYRYSVVQPNSFTDTGLMNEVDVQWRSDELTDKQLLSVGDILVKRLNPSFVHVVTLESAGMGHRKTFLLLGPVLRSILTILAICWNRKISLDRWSI